MHHRQQVVVASMLPASPAAAACWLDGLDLEVIGKPPSTLSNNTATTTTAE